MKNKKLQAKMKDEIENELAGWWEEEEYVPISITITPKLAQAANLAAAFLGISRSELMRDAVSEYLFSITEGDSDGNR
jgi:hypothetical protein